MAAPVELADWREIFEGPDPAAAFWDETSECLSQFADMFDIADKDAEEYVIFVTAQLSHCRHLVAIVAQLSPVVG